MDLAERIGVQADRAEQALRFCYLGAIKSVLDAEQAPTTGDALQLVFAAILKLDA
jgi:hypothetical protein